MCTEKCVKLSRRGPAFPRGRHGLVDLTHPLTTSFPPFVPGEEPKHIGTHVDAPGHFTASGRLATDCGPSSAGTAASRTTVPC